MTRAHWVRPELVGEVEFTEWTSDGRLRHPSFQGLRADKNPRDIVRERPRPVDAVADESHEPGKPAGQAVSARPAAGHPRGRSSARSAGRRQAERRRSPGVRLTHPDRVLYPPQGITKRDLALLYVSIADWILPHLEGRPLTLVRCPEGTEKGCFYMKHSGVWAPARAAAREDPGEDEGRRVPRGGRPAGARLARADGHPGDPHLERGGGRHRAARPRRLRPRSRSGRRSGAASSREHRRYASGSTRSASRAS